jgi:predicted DNA-binding protein
MKPQKELTHNTSIRLTANDLQNLNDIQQSTGETMVELLKRLLEAEAEKIRNK